MHLALLIQSLAMSLGATGLALVAGLLVALALAAGPRRLGLVWIVGGIGALAMPHFVIGATWLEWSANWRASTANPGGGVAVVMATIALGSVLWPLPAGLAYASWRSLAPELLEIDPRARGWSFILRLLAPAAKPSLMVGSILCFALALSNFTIPILFQAPVFTERIWIAFNTRLDAREALTAAWPIICIAIAVGFLLRRTPARWPHSDTEFAGKLISERVGPLAPLLTVCGGAVILATFLWPMWTWISDSRTWQELTGAWAAGKTAAKHSFIDSALAATLAVLASAVVASRSSIRTWLSAVCWVPFFVPGVLLGIGFATVLANPRWRWLADTDGPVILGLGIRYAGVAFAGVLAMVESADSGQIDLVRALSGSDWQVWRVALLPQGAGKLAAIWYIVFLLSLWDVETVILIAPPGGETLAMRVFNLLHYGHAPQVKAVCLLLIGLGLAPLAACQASLLLRRKGSASSANS